MARGAGMVRIVGGHWRSRRVPVANVPGLRPTTDRVRETVFNWLASVVPGARCLDLYAGTGAMGLEALSRGAARVVFIERHPRIATGLRESLATLGAPPAGDALVVNDDARGFLARTPGSACDIIFLDPPFGQGLLDTSLRMLVEGGWMGEDTWVYLEFEHGLEPALPDGWGWWRRSRAGQVDFGLIRSSP